MAEAEIGVGQIGDRDMTWIGRQLPLGELWLRDQRPEWDDLQLMPGELPGEQGDDGAVRCWE